MEPLENSDFLPDVLSYVQVAGDDSSGPLNCFSKRTRASSENILVRQTVFLEVVDFY